MSNKKSDIVIMLSDEDLAVVNGGLAIIKDIDAGDIGKIILRKKEDTLVNAATAGKNDPGGNQGIFGKGKK